jgi:hypothetical protein
VTLKDVAASSGRYAWLAAIFTVLAVVMTWPLGRITMVGLPASDDAYFSVWRLAWIAHQLPSDPARLFDANIFYPATGTLAYSDAMLFVGLLGTPFFLLGFDPGLIHNGLLLAAIVSSMLCAFALARRLTGSDPAALIAALIFGLAPYRMAHIGHLELQWTMWMPLSMLLLHQLVESPALARGVWLGAALAAQLLSSIYYGIFLACYLAAAWIALMPLAKPRRRFVAASAAAIGPLIVAALIYAPPYLHTRAEFGERRPDEVRAYSATASDYLRVPAGNWLYGDAEEAPAPEERSLFPGALAILLAAVAVITARSRATFLYLGLGVLSFDLSLGSNGILFRLLRLVSVAGSLRSPSRFGVLVLLSAAVLAAIGAARIFARYPRMVPLVTLLLSFVCLGEYWSAPFTVRAFESRPGEVDQWLATHPPGTVVLELPTPTGATLWRYEPEYQLRSINHWQPLVNGYSAFPPASYVRLIDLLPSFPEREVIMALRERQVRFIVIHRAVYGDAEFDRVVKAAEASSRLWPVRTFGSGETEVRAFELNYLPE